MNVLFTACKVNHHSAIFMLDLYGVKFAKFLEIFRHTASTQLFVYLTDIWKCLFNLERNSFKFKTYNQLKGIQVFRGRNSQ